MAVWADRPLVMGAHRQILGPSRRKPTMSNGCFHDGKQPLLSQANKGDGQTRAIQSAVTSTLRVAASSPAQNSVTTVTPATSNLSMFISTSIACSRLIVRPMSFSGASLPDFIIANIAS